MMWSSTLKLPLSQKYDVSGVAILFSNTELTVKAFIVEPGSNGSVTNDSFLYFELVLLG